jgi:hypothetical protein
MWGVVYIPEFSFFLFFGWKSKLWDHKLIGERLCEPKNCLPLLRESYAEFKKLI